MCGIAVAINWPEAETVVGEANSEAAEVSSEEEAPADVPAAEEDGAGA